MLGSDYKDQNCSIARALELVGERWTILVLREVFLGRRRFEQMQQALGVARNVLTTRLERLVREGVLERVPYQERPLRHEYHLTDKGLDLWPIIVELLRWGDRYAAPPQGPPIVLRHRDCGGLLGERRICTQCGQPLSVRDVRAEPGPGFAAAAADGPHPYFAESGAEAVAGGAGVESGAGAVAGGAGVESGAGAVAGGAGVESGAGATLKSL